MGKPGKREFVQVLRLMEAFRIEEVAAAVRDAIARGAIGFDAITVALLGRSRPLGTVLAGLLFGALHAGGLAMQSIAQTPLTLTTVLQALIVLFVAAPALVTKIVPFLKPRKTRALGPVPEGGLA